MVVADLFTLDDCEEFLFTVPLFRDDVAALRVVVERLLFVLVFLLGVALLLVLAERL